MKYILSGSILISFYCFTKILRQHINNGKPVREYKCLFVKIVKIQKVKLKYRKATSNPNVLLDHL